MKGGRNRFAGGGEKEKENIKNYCFNVLVEEKNSIFEAIGNLTFGV